MPVSKDDLYRLYVEEGKSDPEIAALYGLTRQRIQMLRKKWQITAMSPTDRIDRLRPDDALLYHIRWDENRSLDDAAAYLAEIMAVPLAVAYRWVSSVKHEYKKQVTPRPRAAILGKPGRESALLDDAVCLRLTKDRTAMISIEDADLARHTWLLRGQYASRYKGGRNTREIIQLHRAVLERILGRSLRKGEEPDHINGDKLDNRRCNLRLATRSQNMANRPKSRNNRSGYKGVIWDKRQGKWRATIGYHGKTTTLGRYDNIEAAARAYDRAARQYFGDFAYLNFPDEI